MRITELIGGVIRNKHRIPGIFNERVTTIVGVGNLLYLLGRGVEGVDGYNTIRLIREEAGSVVDVDDRTSAEDLGVFCGIDGDLLILPMVKILRGSMAPMLIASYGTSWIVCSDSESTFLFDVPLTLVIKMICAIAVSMATVRVVHEILRW